MKLTPGRATAAATKAFIEKSDLPFHHKLYCTKLTINPVIHGPPKLPSLPTDVVLSKMDADRNLAKAIAKHRNNCVYVYEHHPRGAWHSNVVSRMVSEHQAVRREEIVVVAGLGEVVDVRDLRERLSDACRFSGLETIDMAIIKITYETFTKSPDLLDSALAELEELCEAKQLQCFGLELNLPPYSYHAPPAKK